MFFHKSFRIFAFLYLLFLLVFFFFKQKMAYEMRISYWSSDVFSSDLFLSRISADTEFRLLNRKCGLIWLCSARSWATCARSRSSADRRCSSCTSKLYMRARYSPAQARKNQVQKAIENGRAVGGERGCK